MDRLLDENRLTTNASAQEKNAAEDPGLQRKCVGE
jgi:hypothetical protein